MKAVSCILWTAMWIMLLALISLLTQVAGMITAAISVVTVVGLIGSLAILLRDEDGAPVADQPIEHTDAEIVPPISVHVQPVRLAISAPADRKLVHLDR